MILLSLLLASSFLMLVACVTKDDTPGQALPTHPGEGFNDPDPPPINVGGTLTVTPSSQEVAYSSCYGGGNSFYFYVTGGYPPYTWNHTMPEVGNISPVSLDSTGFHRAMKYTLRGYLQSGWGTADDTVWVTDSRGATATATVTIEVSPGGNPTLLPSTFTVTNPAKGKQFRFSVVGCYPPYRWRNSFANNAMLIPNADGSQAWWQYSKDQCTNFTDTIMVSDDTGAVGQGTVQVVCSTGAITIIPASMTVTDPAQGTQFNMEVSGGLPPYTWTHTITMYDEIISFNDTATWRYVAPECHPYSEQVIVTDAAGTKGTATVTVACTD
jgi:hypothetical protein